MSTTTRTIVDEPMAPGADTLPLKQTGALAGRGIVLDRATAVLITLLILAVATDRLGLPVSGFNLRLEFITGGIVAAVALLRLRTAALRAFGLVDLCLGGWLAVNLLSSLLFSPDIKESLKYVAVLVGLLTVYAATRLLVRRGATTELAVVVFVGAGAAVISLGLVCALLFNVIGPNFGVLLERFYRDNVFVVTPKVQGILWEPNIYGSFSMAEGALASALLLARFRLTGLPDSSSLIARLPLASLYVAIALGMCGVMLSMTRTVWVVGPPLILLTSLMAWRLRLADQRKIMLGILLPAALGGVIGLGVGLSLPAPAWTMGQPWELTQDQVDDMVRQRLFGTEATNTAQPTADSQPTTTTADTASPTITPLPVPAGQGSAAGDRVEELLGGNPDQAPSISGRWRVFNDAFAGWLQRPVLGWGAGAFPLVYPPPPIGGYWIANIELHVLFDTGIVGLLLLASAVIVAGWRALQAIRYPTNRWDTQAFITFGLLSAGLGLLAAYQITDGSWLGFTWVLLAMLAATGRKQPINSNQ